MKTLKIVAFGALSLFAFAELAQAAERVTEFRGSRDAVRAFCAERGTEAHEFKFETTCTIRRSQVEITCDDDQNCTRTEPRYAFSGGGSGGGGFSVGNGDGGGGSGGGMGIPGIVIGGGYSSGGNGIPAVVVGGGYSSGGNPGNGGGIGPLHK